jgi:hypothetical protein
MTGKLTVLEEENLSPYKTEFKNMMSLWNFVNRRGEWSRLRKRK